MSTATPTLSLLDDRIEGHVVRMLRQERGLSQEQFAEWIGIPGGKSTVSGWEKGNSVCQGLAARVLQLQTGHQKMALALLEARLEADALWRRTGGTPYTVYRQMAFAFEPQPSIETAQFLTVLPRAQVCGQHPDSAFPLMDGPYAAAVTRSRNGWRFVVPIPAAEAPACLWLLKQDLRFVCRDMAWESTPSALTRGHIDASFTVLHAARACLFARKLARTEALQTDSQVLLRLDLGGVGGRHFVDRDSLGCRGFPWAEDLQFAELRVPLTELTADPLDVAIKLVSELAIHADPEVAAPQRLREICERDRKSGDRPHWERLMGPEGL
jgi:DNA-binding transcriptional regulator YiaG